MAPAPTRLADLAAALGRELEGDGGVEIRGVADLESAGPGDLAFVRSPRHARRLAASRAGAVIVPSGVDPGGRPAIRSPHPGADFARAARRLRPAPRAAPGVHPSAAVSPGARVHETAAVGALCAVAEGCEIGPRSVLHPGVVLYRDARVGADCVLHAGCVLREATRLGDRVTLGPGVVLGGDGFGYEPDGEGGWEKLPQLGRVWVGDDVEIGANTTVDRGTLGDTRIGSRVRIDNLVQVAHNCAIDDDAVVVAQAGLAGSTRLARGAMIMAQAGLAGHLSVGERAFVGARAGVHRDVPAGGRVFGSPQRPERAWHRAMAALGQLPALLRRVRAIERRLGLRPPRPGDDAR